MGAATTSQHEETLTSDVRRRRSNRPAASRSREDSARVIADEAVDNGFFFGSGSPDLDLPVKSPRSRHGETSEEEKESGQPTAEALQALEQGTRSRCDAQAVQQAGVSARPRYIPVPVSALAPINSGRIGNTARPHTVILAAPASVPGENPNTITPATRIPPRTQGWQPLIRPFKKLVTWAYNCLEPGFVLRVHKCAGIGLLISGSLYRCLQTSLFPVPLK